MKAIFPIIDENIKKPYYQQLYDYLKQSILTGEIMKGDKLPSLRNLAKSTGLSITTIEQAYNQLLVEGYIYSKAQSGYYVDDVSSHLNRTVPFNEATSEQRVYPEQIQLPVETPSFYYDPNCFDFNKWKKCMNKIINEYPETLFFESDPQGEIGLRTEIAKYLYVSRGVSCSPEQIVIGAGTQQITNHLSTILRKLQIEHVALENPCYMPVRNILRDRGFAITHVDVSSDGISIEKLPANIKAAVYVTPSNHMFTGSVMPIGRRYELLNWADDNDSYIIEDDYDSELRYFGKPIPALKSLDHNDKVIYLGSFSSTLFAAVKISYMVLPASISKMFADMFSEYSQTCSKQEQLTLAMFMEQGQYQTHIKKLRKLYSQKLNLIIDAFEPYSDFLTVKNTASGINLMLEINTDKPALQLKKDAESLGIPSIVISDDRVLGLYYNQIPLKDISVVARKLIAVWKS
jgi:GntR family transcriptional regulator/MocR family aminotransferase